MNEVYGPIFDVSKAEAATPAMAQERAASLKDQFIMDMHTHFLRDDTRNMNFVNMRTAVGKAGWNKTLAEKEQTIEDLKYAQLHEGDVPRLRHEDRADLVGAVGHRAGLVPDQRADGAKRARR